MTCPLIYISNTHKKKADTVLSLKTEIALNCNMLMNYTLKRKVVEVCGFCFVVFSLSDEQLRSNHNKYSCFRSVCMRSESQHAKC